MYVESCRTRKNDPYNGEEDSIDGKTKGDDHPSFGRFIHTGSPSPNLIHLQYLSVMGIRSLS